MRRGRRSRVLTVPPARLRRGRVHERGSSTVEFVVSAAVMVLLLLVVVQFALYFHLRAVDQTAARHGLDQVRVTTGTPDAGIDAANEFLDQGGTSLASRTVRADRTATTASVSVRGTVVSVVPGVHLVVDVTASAPAERITP